MVARLGDFLVNIDTSVNDKGVRSLTRSLGSLTKSAAGVGTAIAGITAGAGYGFVKLINRTADETAELGRLAKDLGTSTTFLETFTRSFEAMGAGSDEAINTIRTLKKEIEAFKFGKGNIEAFGILGLNPQDLGSDVGRNFNTIRKRFNGLTADQRLYFVDQIGLGEKSLRILRLTDKEYQDLLHTSSKIQLVTSDQLKSAEEYKRNLVEIDQTLTALKRNLLLSATPAFQKFSDELIKLFNDPAFQKNVSSVFEELFKILPDLIRLLPAFANAIIKLSDFLVPDATGDEKIDSSFKARFFSRAADFVSGGPIIDAITGSTYQERQKAARKRRSTEERINQKIPRRDEINQEDILDHERQYGSDVTRIINTKPSLANSNISNTYTINVPVQNAGSDLSPNKMNEFAKIIVGHVEQSAKTASQNFKSGSIR